jgi:hypothetical protein
VFKAMPKFDGVKYAVSVTPKEIIVACGDCSIPAVYFFDNELNQLSGGDFPIENPNKVPLHLAVDFQDPVRNTQLLVGAEARVDLITRQSNN